MGDVEATRRGHGPVLRVDNTYVQHRQRGLVGDFLGRAKNEKTKDDSEFGIDLWDMHKRSPTAKQCLVVIMYQVFDAMMADCHGLVQNHAQCLRQRISRTLYMPRLLYQCRHYRHNIDTLLMCEVSNILSCSRHCQWLYRIVSSYKLPQ